MRGGLKGGTSLRFLEDLGVCAKFLGQIGCDFAGEKSQVLLFGLVEKPLSAPLRWDLQGEMVSMPTKMTDLKVGQDWQVSVGEWRDPQASLLHPVAPKA